MRRLVLAFFLFSFSFSAVSQVGNEWIQFNQSYFKIPVASDGMFRLTHADLQNAGFPVAGDPRKIQLFHRGVEQAIYISGEGDGVFQPADYLEFYGRRNDGTLDAGLYATPANQPHTYYNLYSDTTSYFLTLGSANGKRMELPNTADPGLSPEIFHWDEKLQILHNDFSSGIDYGSVQLTTFDQGEGWTGAQILQTQTGSYTIEGIHNSSVSSGDPTLEILLTGRGPMDHAVEIYAGARLLTTVNFNGYQSMKYSGSLLWTDISNDGKVTIHIKVIGIGGNPDRVSPGYIKLRYPQSMNMTGVQSKVFQLSTNDADVSVVEILNPPPSARVYDITNPASVRRINSTQSGNLRGAISGTSVARKVLVTNSHIVPTVKRVSFRTMNSTPANYVIISHQSLRKPALGFTDPVKAFAEYRSLSEGGGFDTLVVNIDQLYNQFSYGEKTPLAIYNFVKYLFTVSNPRYLFLIGKGLDVFYGYQRNPGAFTTYKDLIPTAGYPASDMAFSQVNGGSHALATGRLTASGPQDVAAYLKKVKESEALPFNDLRRKNLLHLSGGIYQGEPEKFRGYLQQFATVAEDFYLGGQVKAIAKQSTNIELVNVAGEVNNGVGMITFFGHSASSSTDFDIGKVSDPVLGYANQGKYPLLLMNGCSAGSFFLNESIFGENWVNTPNRGALNVIAHSYLAFEHPLRKYSDLFYQIAFGEETSYSRGVGDVQKEVAKRYVDQLGNTSHVISQVQEMVLLGDPAVKIFGAGKPDYEIQPGTVTLASFTNEPVTALSDSFKVSMVINNYGRAVSEGFVIKISRTLNDGSVVVYDSTFNAVLYSDTISFTLPGKIANGFGNNGFQITIDSQNTTDELREDNNAVGINFFIPLSGTLNLYPDNFAIVNNRSLNLTLQHTDQLGEEREFLIELDTVPGFDSDFKKQFVKSGKVLVTQAIELDEKDSLAYYWRSKLANPSASESTEWEESTFTYINNGPQGWAQIHFPQFTYNSSQGLVKDPILRNIEFQETISDISIKTFGSGAGKAPEDVSVRINNTEYNLFLDGDAVLRCRNNTINLVAFDKKSTHPYAGVYLTWPQVGQVGGRAIICGRDPYTLNSYQPDELLFAEFGILNYVDNVDLGDSVVLYSIGNAGFSLWPEAAKQKLGELGISTTQINELQDGEPVVILARKGTAPGSAKVYRATDTPALEQPLTFFGSITGRGDTGSMSSGLIGPARSWNNFINKYSEEDSDEITFDLIGVTLDGTEEVLFSSLLEDMDISVIDAATYPFLKVVFHSMDESFVTSGQLDKWLVTFEPVAEGLLLYRGTVQQQTVNEGEMWAGAYSFVNISNETFSDSLVVAYDISNPFTFATIENQKNINAPLPGDTTKFTVNFGTIGQDGTNTLSVFVNPEIQIERNYNNNIIVLNTFLEVLTDDVAPVLDVKFDGKHIANGEFVSTSPIIQVMLWDNNPYLLKQDTTGVMLLLAYPCADDECDFTRIYFTDPRVTWHKETSNSEFTVHFQPAELQDGVYTLRVLAADANGNASGNGPLEVSFQVKAEDSLEIQPPFPNPFDYKVNFVFQVTGNMPSSMTLEIISMEGRPVFTSTVTDSSQFTIGTNSFSWNAIDTSGSALQNGIYLYRLTVVTDQDRRSKVGKISLVR